MLNVTHSCPLACRYCFVEQEPCHMTYQTARDATDFIIKNAEESGEVPAINFFGGEPMVMWDSIIVPLTDWIRQEYGKPFNLSITTNGVLLDSERIKFMSNNGFGMLLSIDGAKETQDYNRPFHDGRGSFSILEPIIPKILEVFPNTTFRSTIIPATCHHMFENILFAEQNGFNNFFIIPNVFEKWNKEQKNILQNQLRLFSDYFIKQCREGKKTIKFSPLFDRFKEILQINNAITNKLYRTGRSCTACGKCGLGANRFASIHPNGDLYGCQEMTSNEGPTSPFYIGNIYSGVNDNRRLALMNMYDSSKIVGENCVTCKFNRICDGDCIANNYLINHDVNRNLEMMCYWKQILLNEAIYISQILGTEENETFFKIWRENT